jgi:hypothetical protein
VISEFPSYFLTPQTLAYNRSSITSGLSWFYCMCLPVQSFCDFRRKRVPSGLGYFARDLLSVSYVTSGGWEERHKACRACRCDVFALPLSPKSDEQLKLYLLCKLWPSQRTTLPANILNHMFHLVLVLRDLRCVYQCASRRGWFWEVARIQCQGASSMRRYPPQRLILKPLNSCRASREIRWLIRMKDDEV